MTGPSRDSRTTRFGAVNADQFQGALLAWYDASQRDLPWRKDKNPYRIWLSEIMLQQTRVAAVLEHYADFLKRFPSIEKLASAPEQSVLSTWSGLGYYRRARMLHAAAKVIVEQQGGKIPTTSRQLEALPGIGRYTAAAIASIAFGEPVAVVDGNVERVLSRCVGRILSKPESWRKAEAWLSRERPGDFNQSMMELGATVCTPRQPKCLMCPVASYCRTKGESSTRKKSSRQRKVEIAYTLVRRNGAVFLRQRPASSKLMPGMWELPECVLNPDKAEPIFRLKHSITVTDYTVNVYNAGDSSGAHGEWIPLKNVEQTALTGLARKILRKAGLLSPKKFRGIEEVDEPISKSI